jgi:hypothetical protein
MGTLVVQLNARNLRATAEGVAIVVSDASERHVKVVLDEISSQVPVSAESVAATVKNKINQKHHVWLDEYLLNIDYASSELDIVGAHKAAVGLLL